ncbi:recombinase family protein [Fructilactobacillus carniphilus]|uniref:Recombinase family protein n=1 Tax=Fructilactobacillus carniphilus TaxID=2940297 RepID=A0ABY5BYI3_9LACO|nr:recombinase family protein [Fructilactobacillus carniphilus]USS90688.1 recombinase family protein [Fructilactobacillus carniphilus]
MKFGYARVSSASQNLERQIRALEQEGCEQIYQEKISGKNLERPELNDLLRIIKADDEVVVLDLDRLGRNNQDITNVMNQIREKHATFRILSLPSFDGVSDPNLKALLNNLIIEIYKYQAEAERQKIRERQRQGIEIAKQNGLYKGRATKYSLNSKNPQGRIVAKRMIEMFNVGLGDSQIAETLGVSRKTIYNKRQKFIKENKF